MNLKRNRSHQRGFSLVEILVAMVLIAVALLGILSLQAASIRSSLGGRGRETGVYVCQTFLDSVEAEAQRLNLANSYSIPASTTAVNQFFGTGASASTSGTLYFDLNGTATTAANKIFTLAWSRLATRDSAPKCFEFAATATWSYETDTHGNPLTRTVQVNRLVRID